MVACVARALSRASIRLGPVLVIGITIIAEGARWGRP
jgi:hypothetical protein